MLIQFSFFVVVHCTTHYVTSLYLSVRGANRLAARPSITKINRSVGSVLEFKQNESQNRQEFLTIMNNKAAFQNDGITLVIYNFV